MTDTTTAPPVDAAPLFIAPDPTDAAARRAEPKAPPKVAADPEAPHGWMTDPKTGEKRPKKTAGRRGSGSKPVAAPRKRAANRPRVTTPPATLPATPTAPVGDAAPFMAADHTEQVASVVDIAWALCAAAPTPQGPWFGRFDARPFVIRLKAQAEILRQQKTATSRGVGAIADHVEPVGRFVEWISDPNGPAWVLPAALALGPLVSMSVAVWRSPVDERVATLAAQTDQIWSMAQESYQQQFLGAQQDAPAPAPAGRFPGEDPLPIPGV